MSNVSDKPRLRVQTTVDVIAHLRDTQVYVHCARDGASVFDLPRALRHAPDT